MSQEAAQSGSRQRIDRWLFFARVTKSRSLAQERVTAGHVKVNGQTVRHSSYQLKVGDRVEVALERRTLVLVVVAPGQRRGPYDEARGLYEDLTPPPSEQERLSSLEQAVRAPGAGRPTKRERRVLDEFRSRGDWLDD